MPDRLSKPEFIALMAMLFATIALSIDAMLPALPEITQALTPDAPNKAQLILTLFVLGMGLGTFVTGPLSDTFGRKRVLLSGAALYTVAALAATLANSLELLLFARFVQGIGAAGPRVVAMAIIRDLYSGRQMAQLISLVMLIFAIVPAFAPSVGAAILLVTGWRGIFAVFILFSALTSLWLALRQAETLPPERRRPLRLGQLTRAIAEVFGLPMVRLSILVQGLCMGILFSTISTIQQVYDITFGRADSFPLWFGFVALIASSASIINARLVVRLGMRYLITLALGAQIVLSGLALAVYGLDLLPGDAGFALWVVWNISLFFMVGLTLGNLNALAMEPLGHIAGMAASVISSVATVMAVVIAIPIGLAFDGTPVPLAAGILACAVLGFVLIRRMARLERVSGPAI
ncbi:multidrug effflux MFS transporter [Actibacterium ureilyticum]|uniref:multidrug effflux MFS transporter n=1 Tax=Actibacterium ureilyticum TaxID=1590614 RepID=UPI000BAAE64A|nr:multidrug effflux MFS transporter [Actibacterium ureilyticum]